MNTKNQRYTVVIAFTDDYPNFKPLKDNFSSMAAVKIITTNLFDETVSRAWVVDNVTGKETILYP